MNPVTAETGAAGDAGLPAPPVCGADGGQAGARRLTIVFFAVVAGLLLFYGYLTHRSLQWSPSFFIESGDPSLVATAEGERNSLLASTAVGRGEESYRRGGCALCHGLGGRGGVLNPNYVNETTPALDRLAERLFLQEPEDVEAVLAALEGAGPLDAQGLDVPRADTVVAQYASVRDLILNGNVSGRKDPAGPPPFDMPAWREKLTPGEIDDIIAYLLSRYPWEEEQP